MSLRKRILNRIKRTTVRIWLPTGPGEMRSMTTNHERPAGSGGYVSIADYERLVARLKDAENRSRYAARCIRDLQAGKFSPARMEVRMPTGAVGTARWNRREADNYRAAGCSIAPIYARHCMLHPDNRVRLVTRAEVRRQLAGAYGAGRLAAALESTGGEAANAYIQADAQMAAWLGGSWTLAWVDEAPL